MNKTKLVCVLVAAALRLAAQTSSGSVSGSAVDASHAAVVNAAVALEEQEKKFTLNAKSDEAGRFVFATVPPGTYKLTVQVAGFKEFTQTGIVLDSNDRLALGDIVMQ